MGCMSSSTKAQTPAWAMENTEDPLDDSQISVPKRQSGGGGASHDGGPGRDGGSGERE